MSTPNPFQYFPFMFPPGGGLSEYYNQQDQPPARVRTALTFLNDLTSKTSPKVYPAGELKMEEIPGQKLDIYEGRAQEAACELLRQYFTGELRPDCYEASHNQITSRSSNNLLSQVLEGRQYHCPECSRKEKPDLECSTCKGSGVVYLLPGPPRLGNSNNTQQSDQEPTE